MLLLDTLIYSVKKKKKLFWPQHELGYVLKYYFSHHLIESL